MTIGIIGSGAIGTAFARTLARAGIEATISNSRGRAHSARAHEFGDGGQQVGGEYEQVNHRHGR
jgi:predicted dinucleotide-binding enzyme